MSAAVAAAGATRTVAAHPSPPVLQRKCACGGKASELTGECGECSRDTSLGLQKKLAIGGRDDPLEREADHAAAQVMGMRGGAFELSRHARPVLSRVANGNGGDGSVAPPSVHRTLATTGSPLTPALREFFEPRYGHDFAGVRVHRDAAAAQSAAAVGARAYTVGSHIVFGAGAYAPSTDSGRSLIGHELAHVLQQGHGRPHVQRQADPAAGGAPSASMQEPGALDTVFGAIRATAVLVPALAPLAASIDLIRGAIDLYRHRNEHLQRLLDGIGTQVNEVPALARTKMAGFLAGVGGRAAEAGACVGDQLLLLLDSLALNWRGVIESFIRDLVFVGLFERSIPAIFRLLGAVSDDLLHGDIRSAIDHGVALMTEVNAIAGVLFIWFALITTVLGTAAGSEVPVAGNAAGAAAGMTLAQVINIGLVASVVATETTRVGRGIDDMVRFWDDPIARQAGCRQVAEGVFSLALTALLFYLGPGIQRMARSIIGRAAAAVGNAARSLTRELSVVPGLATPGGGVMPFAGPEPGLAPRPASPRPGTVRPAVPATRPATGTGTGTPSVDPAPSPRPGAGPAGAVSPATEDPTRRVDACRDLFNLAPGIQARWHNQRMPINGNVTVQAAAFRLDAGTAPPTGQGTTPNSRSWARAIGLPVDDAGHVIGRRFGGTAQHNGASGNIFPQNLSVNRGLMVVRDREAAELHVSGCDVCVHLRLNYNAATDLRPAEVVHTILARRPGTADFTPPSPPRTIPNP